MGFPEKLFKSELERTRELVRAPDWYLEFGDVQKIRSLAIGAIQATFSGRIFEAIDAAKLGMLDIFEELLAEHSVRLGIPGKEELDDQDEAREPIDQIVIHHSSRAEGITNSRLNAMHLLSLYVPVYQSKTNPVLNSKGEHQPIYSGHFDADGNQVFYGYHWKVAKDGSSQRLLEDCAIGWHAGNWAVNKRSIGICIDDDLEHSRPTNDSLESVAEIIRKYYSDLPMASGAIIGHNEASTHTICPGDQFLGGWKDDLLRLVSN